MKAIAIFLYRGYYFSSNYIFIEEEEEALKNDLTGNNFNFFN